MSSNVRDMNTLETLRQNVLRLLEQKGLNGSDLARGLDHSTSWSYNFLTGKKTIPLPTIQAIAHYLDVPTYSLLIPPGESDTAPDLSQGLSERTSSEGSNLPIDSGSPATKEGEHMPTKEPDYNALLNLLPTDTAESIRREIKRCVVTTLFPGEDEGKFSAR